MTPSIGALYKVNLESQISRSLYTLFHQQELHMNEFIIINKVESDIIIFTRLNHGDSDFMHPSLFEDIFVEVAQ